MLSSAKATILVIKVRIPPAHKNEFIDWQTKLNMEIAAFPGFVSLEILSPTILSEGRWVISQRLATIEDVKAWQASKEYVQLMHSLQMMLKDHEAKEIQQEAIEASNLQNTVTEVFVTQVSPDKNAAFEQWIARIHRIEAKFPGFRGVYVQSPHSDHGKNWITFLQFDTTENMDRWMNSPERKEVLEESKHLIASIESHRVLSSYAGWFASIAKDGELPPVWKQTMIVLLILFPIVMIELKYLNPLLGGLNLSFATFIGNAISVTLISWPMMPIAIGFLGWWLSPEGDRTKKTIYGTIIVFLLYLIEIGIFWKFLP